jgi:alkanesulfonate monooxygenase SsuD/methylene tetrahydromethanopterin reductase-like flavin-dependent oxidoreductase (luciferase family)
VKFAVGVPNVREYADPRLLMDLARRTEAAGRHGFFVRDHVVYHRRGDAVVDPGVLAGAIGATERVRFGVLVCALPRRRPWIVAREVATLDLSHRDRSAPFDVVMEGQSTADRAGASAFVRRYGEAGLTWWVEQLGWFRGPLDQMLRRIESGPPW